jgi:cyanophycinase-like exopeptidase
MAVPVAGAAPGFSYYSYGNPGDVRTHTRGLVVLQGGGDDVDVNYVRMGERAGGGDFVVLRASGGDDYNRYIYDLCKCDSVESIVFDNREASFDPFVINKIRNAEALFLAGGDQSRYLRFWQDTPVQDAINFVAAKPAPVGGTSAGMAIIGQFSYSAMTDDSLTAAAALADPFHVDLTLSRNFLDIDSMQGIITDQHLIERDRIGRTVALLARLLHDGWTTRARAIAADRETSVHVDPESGAAEIFSTADHETPHAYFMQASRAPDRIERGSPLTLHDIEVYRVEPGATFNVREWTGHNGIAYTLDVIDGRLGSSRKLIY